MTIVATLCFIVNDDRILLLKKSKGLLGQGKWNAPGGKILPNEEPEACAIREVLKRLGSPWRNRKKLVSYTSTMTASA